MNTPSVSVVIGTYNCVRFLPGLWACLDAQTFRDFEIVVVDDASDDGDTLSALEAMGDRIRLIRRTTNSRTCELPRYQGVKAARAPLCAFLDADDRWHPAFLERTVAHLKAHPQEALVHTYVRIIDGEDREHHIRHEGIIPEGDAVARALAQHCFITISAVVTRRDIWLDALREEDIVDFGMDQDFFLSIAKHYPIGFIAEPLGLYRRSSASVSVKNWKRIPRNVNTLERIRKRRLYEGAVRQREMKAILSEAYIENAIYWRGRGKPARALWAVRQGLRVKPLSLPLWRGGIKSLGRAAWPG